MRLSRSFVPTLRDDPAEAEIASHRLLLRAGFVRQVAAGIYTFLPMGLRAMRKIAEVIREEMDGSGAIEIRMPITLPAEPWKATGRWELYGDQLFRLQDRHGRDMLLGPTEEEVVTPLVASELTSYRDLPINLYQFEWKYRDEFRPRFGLLRGREFLMKDAYSFDRDDDGMRQSYRIMYEAYERVFDRLQMDYAVVEAEAGQIGGGINHEFLARASVGEDLFVECEHGDYTADLKAARPRPPEPAGEPTQELTKMHTPDTPTIETLAAFLKVEPSQTLKCVMFHVADRTVAVLVPGDREVNEAKLEQLVFPETVRRFDDEGFATGGFVKGYVGHKASGTTSPCTPITGARGPGLGHRFQRARSSRHRRQRRSRFPGGFLGGPGGAPRRRHLSARRRHVACGPRHRAGSHLPARHEVRGAVGGHLGRGGRLRTGVSHGVLRDRPLAVLAAAAEQYHDDDGLVLPKVLAPFQVVVVPWRPRTTSEPPARPSAVSTPRCRPRAWTSPWTIGMSAPVSSSPTPI